MRTFHEMNLKQLEGVLWDMDGVLVDTSEAHFRAWQSTLVPFGRHITREDFLLTFGRNNNETVRILWGSVPKLDMQRQIVESKERSFRQMVIGSVHLLPGVMYWLQWFQRHGLRQAIASSAPKENIEAIVKQTQIGDFFGALVWGDELPSKPEPDIFLSAAHKIDINPSRCLVIEDSPAGIEAAKRAGMRCLGVATSYPPSRLGSSDLVVSTLEELVDFPLELEGCGSKDFTRTSDDVAGT